MMHTLELTKGSRAIAASMLNIPDQFKTLTDMGNALSLAKTLDMEGDELPKAALEQEPWAQRPAPVQVTESQRDLLKKVCTENVSRLPVNEFTEGLLKTLGLLPAA